MRAMTTQQVNGMIQSMGFPCAYHHFNQAARKPPPYICFFYPSNDDLFADNKNYATIAELRIELYTKTKDFAAERAVEAVLKEYDQPYSKDETYINEEATFLIIYTTEVYINE